MLLAVSLGVISYMTGYAINDSMYVVCNQNGGLQQSEWWTAVNRGHLVYVKYTPNDGA